MKRAVKAEGGFETMLEIGRSWVILAAGCFLSIAASHPGLALSVELAPVVEPPAVVGTVVIWGAAADASGPNLWYRYRVRRTGADYQVLRDYGPQASLAWTPLREGNYEVEVSVRDLDAGDIAAASSIFQVTSAVVNGQPTVSPTANPQVFLFSSPGCRPGYRMQVVLQNE